MTNELKQCRAEFEKWAASSPANEWFWRTADTKDGYVDGVTNVAFAAWQAAWQLSRQNQGDIAPSADNQELAERAKNWLAWYVIEGRNDTDMFLIRDLLAALNPRSASDASLPKGSSGRKG